MGCTRIEYVSWFKLGKNIFKYYLPEKTQLFETFSSSVRVPMLLSEDEIPSVQNRYKAYYDNHNKVLSLNRYEQPYYVDGIIEECVRPIGKMMESKLRKITGKTMTFKSFDTSRIGDLVFTMADETYGSLYFKIKGCFEAVGWKLADGHGVGVCGFWSTDETGSIYDGLKEYKVKLYSGGKPEIKISSKLLESGNNWWEIKENAIETYIKSKQNIVNSMARLYKVSTVGTKEVTIADLM